MKRRSTYTKSLRRWHNQASQCKDGKWSSPREGEKMFKCAGTRKTSLYIYYGIAKQIVHLSTRGRRRTTWSYGYMVHQWVTQGTKGSIDNARRPERGRMMRPTINEESDCLRKKNLLRRRLVNQIVLGDQQFDLPYNMTSL